MRRKSQEGLAVPRASGQGSAWGWSLEELVSRHSDWSMEWSRQSSVHIDLDLDLVLVLDFSMHRIKEKKTL